MENNRYDIAADLFNYGDRFNSDSIRCERLNFKNYQRGDTTIDKYGVIRNIIENRVKYVGSGDKE